MTKSDLITHLGTVSKSAAEGYAEAYALGIDRLSQFGIGFYSAYLVADRVVVHSKHQSDHQYVWEAYPSTAGSFLVTREDDSFFSSASIVRQGTRVELYLKEDMLEYLETAHLEELIRKYHETAPFSIKLISKVEESGEKTITTTATAVSIVPQVKEELGSSADDVANPLYTVPLSTPFSQMEIERSETATGKESASPSPSKQATCSEYLLESCCCMYINQTGVTDNFIYPPFCSCSCYLCMHLMNPLCLYANCCAHTFQSDTPVTIAWLGDIHVLGGIQYGEWKDISESLRYTCFTAGNFTREQVQKTCYLSIYTFCLPFVLYGGVCPAVFMPCNCWNGSLLLTSLQKKGYRHDKICTMFGMICCISIPHKQTSMQNEYVSMDIDNFTPWWRGYVWNCCFTPETKYPHQHHELGYSDQDYMRVNHVLGTIIRTGANAPMIATDFNETHFIGKNEDHHQQQ